MTQYSITTTGPADAVAQIAQWHRHQARLAMSRAQAIAANTVQRRGWVDECSHHNNSAEFLEALVVKTKVTESLIKRLTVIRDLHLASGPAPLSWSLELDKVIASLAADDKGTIFDARELATVLAGLRMWQRAGDLHAPEWVIAIDAGAPLSDDEIDVLFDRLNGPAAMPKECADGQAQTQRA